LRADGIAALAAGARKETSLISRPTIDKASAPKKTRLPITQVSYQDQQPLK
jgi:hypothetical protein